MQELLIGPFDIDRNYPVEPRRFLRKKKEKKERKKEKKKKTAQLCRHTVRLSAKKSANIHTVSRIHTARY